MSEEEVKKLLGLDAELYYVRDDVVNHYALSFILPVPSDTNSLHFTWHSSSKVDYRLGFQVENTSAMDQPQSNISAQGEVPRTRSALCIGICFFIYFSCVFGLCVLKYTAHLCVCLISGYPSLRIEKNDLRSVSLLEAKAKVKDIAISRERVTLRDVLHEGTFGRIFHGVLLDEKDPSKEKQVFVKAVKDHASEVQVTMMLTESCKLRGLHHRNLLPISHVCIEDGEKPMVLLPYMNWGNLKLFLRQCKLAEANNPQAISQQDLVHMAIQISCGMSYLARREVIHKDLAARNCVIDNSMQVKITDNALARDLFPMDYHCLGDNENRPVRWMALESLLNNDFSSASDVWAFGVSLWELMTLGQTPYVDIDPFEMAAYLKDGYRIAQPINCPDELFAVMACCWALDLEERPKFQQLVQCLTEFHAALGAYV
uniref:receptor protein-tyrosine kinase n=1 Tax=Cyprinus carpio TaxID=7962 RepID=A0A8C1PCQ7_CYPCA